MTPDLSILESATLTAGQHTTREQGMCAMEAVACAMGLPFSDYPACTDRPLAKVFQRVNDWARWGSDAARSDFLRPYLMRLGRLAIAGKRAPPPAYGFAAADLACRVIAPAALDRAKLPELAAQMRALGMVVDRETATKARDVGYSVRSKAAAAYAAYAAAYAAAAYAAYAADAAAYAYAYAYARQKAYRETAGELLTRLLDVCESGVWPLPDGWERAA